MLIRARLAAHRHGFVAFFTLPWTHGIWTQEVLDLAIALTIVSGWLIGDARRRGANPWPYVALTPLLGSIAPLTYLVLRPAACPPQPGEISSAP